MSRYMQNSSDAGTGSSRCDIQGEAEGQVKVKTVDPAPPDEQVQIWMWLPGLAAVLIMTCVVMRMEFSMPVSEVLLALFLAFFFSLLAIQSSGASGKCARP